MRVTSTSVNRRMLANLNRALVRLDRSQTRAATGKVLNRLSDDPVRLDAALRARSELATLERVDRHLVDAERWLSTADSALTQVLEKIRRVDEVALAALDGAVPPGSAVALSNEIRQLRDGIMDLANTTLAGRPVFAGGGGPPAFDPTTGAYLGDAAAVMRRTSASDTVQVNLPGDTVFGVWNPVPLSGNLFQVLDELATQVAAGNRPGIEAARAALGPLRRLVEDALGTVGGRAGRVTDARAVNEARRFDLTKVLSETEDTDLAAEIVEMRTAEASWQAALAVTARVIRPSLADYLR